MHAIIFLLLLLGIGVLAKNESLIVAVAFLLVLKLIGLEKWLPLVQTKGIQWGVTIITIAVLAPIATGEIGFKQLIASLQSVSAWVALLSGIFVALVARGGITLLSTDPHITAALVLGTIIAVSFFNGVAVGPLIGAGIAYMVIKVIEYL